MYCASVGTLILPAGYDQTQEAGFSYVIDHDVMKTYGGADLQLQHQMEVSGQFQAIIDLLPRIEPPEPIG